MLQQSAQADYFQLSTYQTDAFRRASRHSRRVRILRLVLPVVGVFAVCAIIIGAWVANQSTASLIARALIAANSLTMQNPHLTGYADGRAYEVFADRALQALSNPDLVELEKIRATLDEGGGNEARITAEKGSFDTTSDRLTLRGDITLEMVSGLSGRLSEAEIDMKASQMVSNEPVFFERNGSSIRAGRMTADTENEILYFEDAVKMVIMPDAAEKDE